MPSALVPLANLTLGSSAATVTFSSISGSYRDLLLVINAQVATTSQQDMLLRINGDTTAANYSTVRASGNGSSATSGTYTAGAGYLTDYDGYLTNTSGVITTKVINIMDYSATDKHKTALMRSNNASTGTDMLAARWASTSAVTTLLCYLTGDSFAAGSTFSLFGVSA